MSAPLIEIEGKAIMVYQRVADMRSRKDRLLRRPERTKQLIGAFVMDNSPEVRMERKLNAPSTLTISPITARSPL